MVFIYLHSFAHGSLPHNNCQNHQTNTPLHQHEKSDTHEDTYSDLHVCSSSGIIHSIFHFIESLAHSQFAHDEPMVVEANDSNFQFIDFIYAFISTEKVGVQTYKSKPISTESWCNNFNLFHSPLRGPPCIV